MTEQERYSGKTPFQEIYKRFFSTVTEDMYLEWTEEETAADIKNILITAMPSFKYPRFKIFDYEKTVDPVTDETVVGDSFNFLLDEEEIGIYVSLMVIEWIGRQLTTVDATRQKYSSRDFAFTSQANHLDKLIKLKQEYVSEDNKKQKLYRRRIVNDQGYVQANFGRLGGKKNVY
jgi:CRISPR/Cas system CMR subunit Cmr4 (Cas7 group RAMP superfamily)